MYESNKKQMSPRLSTGISINDIKRNSRAYLNYGVEDPVKAFSPDKNRPKESSDEYVSTLEKLQQLTQSPQNYAKSPTYHPNFDDSKSPHDQYSTEEASPHSKLYHTPYQGAKSPNNFMKATPSTGYTAQPTSNQHDMSPISEFTPYQDHIKELGSMGGLSPITKR
eukprot:CAMPEP_0114581242 /NCGR_PEP_ID=MMETSP0125-20121206/5383_1 /TAXON_ID=485358 ORGANISM="Aristerostoma sp., Strain ATCC 50986" /NCGR_SAMPLE_ID=MMETSP0125 /ASSEMBLY_ACC=CAM_ASM_000245 /LENGTH=165 /DNA_ID=CAMNT_0001773319 /DNA_START=904 /DNA_END=1401 /DNA_ORIENTATION=+